MFSLCFGSRLNKLTASGGEDTGVLYESDTGSLVKHEFSREFDAAAAVSYAYLGGNNWCPPATHCSHDQADMDADLSSDVMTMSPTAMTPVVRPLSNQKGLYSPFNFTPCLGVFVCRGAAHSVWLSEKSSCFYNAVAALYVAE